MEIKPPTTIDEQIAILERRGCIIGDREFARRALNNINYYRLTTYFLPYRHENNTYDEGLTFEKVSKVYEFDRKLRGILFPIIEETEIALRSKLAYYHAHKYGAQGYMDEANFNTKHRHKEFLHTIKGYINKNETLLFVKHHINKYDSQFPVWVIIELFSLGQLSRFYGDMLTPDRKAFAHSTFGLHDTVVKSWLECLTSLRNHCAHYSRLYYYHFPRIPATVKNSPYVMSNSVFDYIYMLKFMYSRIGDWETASFIPLQSLIEQYAEYIELEHMNFPEDWGRALF